MSEFVQQAADYPTQGPAWLKEFQSQAVAEWQKQALPGRKTENWKYTNLKHIETAGFYSSQVETADLTYSKKIAIEGMSGPVLVFVDGVYAESLSHNLDQLQSGLNIVRFSEADEKSQSVIQQNLGEIVGLSKTDEHTFAVLNSGKFEEGVLIHTEKNTLVEQPIQLVYLTLPNSSPVTVNQRTLVVAEEGSQMSFVERYISEGEQTALTNGVTEIQINDNAKVIHYRLHNEEESCAHIGGVHTRLERSANYQGFHLALGSKLTRVDAVVHHKGEGAHCDMNGVYLPRNKQHVDYHTTIEHAVPHCTSSEVFRGIVGDSARAVFNGRIHIHPDAQKTLAQLSNKNLLTSNKAEIDTKPELEIYADDVQCAHGATVAQLEDESLHYFQTRGISEKEARVMLSFGFINELINQLVHEPVADAIRPELAQLFAKEPELLEHLG